MGFLSNSTGGAGFGPGGSAGFGGSSGFGGGRPSKAFFVAGAGIIAALYVGLSFISGILGLSSGLVQLRLSEALYVLALFTPAALPGLTIGCLLFNWISGCVVLDIVFGTLATLIGAVGTFLVGAAMRKRSAGGGTDAGVGGGTDVGVGGAKSKKFHFGAWLALALIPPILANTFALPLIFIYGYGMEGTYLFFAAFIFVGELLSCGVLGFLLGMAMKKRSLV